jgi:DNA transformation protein and related proteins
LHVSAGFRQFVLDQLAEVMDVTPRAMFGGVGLYAEDVFLGIIAGDELYLKVDDTNRPDFEAAGMHPFKPYPHRPTTMQYYATPIAVVESPAELKLWAGKSVAAARRAAAKSRRPPRT